MVDSPTKNARLLALSFALLTSAFAIFFAMQVANAIFRAQELQLAHEGLHRASAALFLKGQKLELEGYRPLVGSWYVTQNYQRLFRDLLALAESDPEAAVLDEKYGVRELTSN